MTLYSHSRLQSFEQCKYKYKLKYLNKIPPPIKKSVESHLGECVHDALEWFYQKVINGKVPELDELIEKDMIETEIEINESIKVNECELRVI